MINNDKIKAKIDSEKQTIAFIDAQSVDQGADLAREQEFLTVIEQLEKYNKRIIELMHKVEKSDGSIKQSNEFIKKNVLGKDAARDQESSGDFQSQYYS